MKRVSGRQLVRLLERLGWRVDRTKGSHRIMRHAKFPRTTLSVPVHGNQTLPIGTLTEILKDAQVDAEQFNELV
ncbi:MAG: type II toxin-antitoxin system HicA family toxin [Chloroflexi bacterium]|nr:type II toxin-antitoxin system HicA family toxin [Chloroflexota bacterium]